PHRSKTTSWRAGPCRSFWCLVASFGSVDNLTSRPRCQRWHDVVHGIAQEADRAVGEGPIRPARMLAPEVMHVAIVAMAGPESFWKLSNAGLARPRGINCKRVP